MGDKGLQQSCPSLGNEGRWESSSGGDGAKEGPGLVGAVPSAAVVDPEALGDLLAAQWAGAQRLAALLTAADMAAGEEDHLGLRKEQQQCPDCSVLEPFPHHMDCDSIQISTI